MKMKDTTGERRPRTGIILLSMILAVSNAFSISYPEADRSSPSPMPTFPSAFDAYTPPADQANPLAGAPVISEWTRSNGPGDTMALSGSGMPSDYAIYAPTYFKTFSTPNWFGEHGALTLPFDLPLDEMYLLWPLANGLAGTPVAINRTESWWMTELSNPGEEFSVFGRNLGSSCWVWIEETGEWLQSRTSNPYQAEFVVPAGYSTGTYTVWAHNGNGREYGFAQPMTLTVKAALQWDENPGNWFDVTDYGAKGDGVTEDWFGAIEAAINAADAVEWSTVYFPPGDYRIGSKLRLTGIDNVRIVGAGMDLVTIQPHSSYSSSSWPKYLIHNTLVDVEFKGFTLKANSYGGEQIIRMESGSDRVVFDGIRLDQYTADITYAVGTLSSDKILYMGGVNNVRLLNCEFIEKVNLLATKGASQIFVENCTFIGSYDANTLFGISDSTGISIVDSVARNYDDTASDSTSSAWCQGRWVHGNGGIRDFYFNGNATINMTPRTGWSDPNVGEQLMFEFCRTHFRGVASSAAAKSVTFSFAPSSTLVGQVLVIQEGRGQGQSRVVTGVSGNTITVDREWDASLDSSSAVLVGKYSKHLAIYQNSFDGRPRALGSSFVGNAGIEPYGGCVDLVADGNTFHQLRFPINVQSKDTTGDQGQINQPNFFNLFMNNTADNCYNAIAMYVDKTVGVTYRTPQLLGNVYRKNTFSNLASSPMLYHGDFSSSVTGEEIHMQIFDKNTESNYSGPLVKYETIEASGVYNQVTIEASALPPPPDPPPAPILTSIAISGPTSLDEETTAQYICTASYSDGTTAAVAASWSENSANASISASGELTVGSISADQSATITASFGGLSDTYTVTINYVPPVLMGIIVSGAVSLDEETSSQYSCTANYSDGTSVVVTPAWSENSAYATISGSGLLSAGSVSADQGVTLTASYGGKTDTHSVTINYVPPTLMGIVVSGSTSLNEETTAQYACTATYSDGTSVVVTPAWSENSAYATISTSGLLSVGNIPSDQGVTLTASFGGKSDTHSVTIKYVAPVLSGIIIAGPSTVNEETSSQYICTANYSDGTSVVITPVWSENSTYAIISASGSLTAGDVSADQGVTLTAIYGGKSDTHSVTIKYVPPVLTGIVISGAASLDEETTAQYACTASYSDGTSKTVTPTWIENSADATISTSGSLTAGDVSADQSVVITASYGGQSDTHSVTIKYVAPVLTDIVVSGPAAMDEETSAQYVCTANYSDGTSETVTPTWVENSTYTTINISGLLTAADVSVNQNVTITAIHGGKSDTHAVVVTYVVPPVVLSSITIAGPGSVEENTSAQYVCTAHYSDGTSNEIIPDWSENSTFSAIDGLGVLGAGNVASDENVTVTASFEDQTASQALVIMAIGDQVVFPLSGFTGQTIAADLWDHAAQVWVPLGIEFEPEEIVIENINPGQWYKLVLSEYNEVTGEETTVHASWISM